MFPPTGPVTTQQTIPSYLFQQYSDDQALQAFVSAFNTLAQQYVNTFNQLNLPIYTRPPITGALLDWVGSGLYGVIRPNMPAIGEVVVGPYNTFPYNTTAYNSLSITTPTGTGPATDDIYRRVITWRFFKGDGKQFNVTWLKRRIERFLYGVNGIDPGIQQTNDISITFGSGHVWNILLPNVAAAGQCKFGIGSGVLELPFQFTYDVTIS